MNTTEHEQLVEDILGIFSALDTSDSIESEGFGSQRELAVSDLQDLTREELINDIAQADRFLSKVWPIAAEVDSVTALIALNGARNRVEAALERVSKA